MWLRSSTRIFCVQPMDGCHAQTMTRSTSSSFQAKRARVSFLEISGGVGGYRAYLCVIDLNRSERCKLGTEMVTIFILESSIKRNKGAN